MQKKSQRLVELDFLRGLVLLVIVVDHIGGSILSRFTLHSYAFCDAAEVFVFLGGYATATAYLSLAAKRDETAARLRFMRRALEIYRAFLVTAGLMLVISAAFVALGMDEAPNLAYADLDSLTSTPFQSLIDILLLRRQPYLASVLPMYAFFALAVPLALPLARKKPWLLAAGSVALWAAASHAIPYLPAADDMHWDFNPFAWQLMFLLGVLARCQPVYQRVSTSHFGPLVSGAAFVIIAALCFAKLVGVEAALRPEFKQNLEWLRVVNFLAIAWLVADMIRIGWVGKTAEWLPWIGIVGRKGLLCFIAGTGISLIVDSALYTMTDGLLDVPLGLAADAIAIGALLAVAKVYGPLVRVLAVKTS
ncbi:OpgC domain-containing protein [Trinickia terrae]|uniref:OpgC domain-containing protein n=1 Tax=Trinickia terrae TaxID=2571161 RepID=A0A4U1IFM3_9BURK|nr:OpgC domain-containing protein [Trinickia terrae]TKC92518.1 OpgC domain-containing protein [Trinickia terrae]